MTTVISRNNKYKQQKQETKKKNIDCIHMYIPCAVLQNSFADVLSTHLYKHVLHIISAQFSLLYFAHLPFLFIFLSFYVKCAHRCRCLPLFSLFWCLFVFPNLLISHKYPNFMQIYAFISNISYMHLLAKNLFPLKLKFIFFFSQTQIYLTKIPWIVNVHWKEAGGTLGNRNIMHNCALLIFLSLFFSFNSFEK